MNTKDDLIFKILNDFKEMCSISEKTQEYFVLKFKHHTRTVSLQKDALYYLEIFEQLKEEFSKFLIKKEVEDFYNYIIVSPSLSNNVVYVWRKFDGKDREYIGISNINDKKTLEKINLKCKEINNRSDLFICSSCNEICIEKEKEYNDLNKLLDDRDPFLKFTAFAGYYCSKCVESNKDLKREYERYLKMGTAYFD